MQSFVPTCAKCSTGGQTPSLFVVELSERMLYMNTEPDKSFSSTYELRQDPTASVWITGTSTCGILTLKWGNLKQSLETCESHGATIFFILCIFQTSRCVCLPSVACGGTLNATTAAQTLTSPSYPDAYAPYTSCRWILDAPALENIQVSVQTFALQPSQSCTTNYLEMKDWPVVSSDRDGTKTCCILGNETNTDGTNEQQLHGALLEH